MLDVWGHVESKSPLDLLKADNSTLDPSLFFQLFIVHHQLLSFYNSINVEHLQAALGLLKKLGVDPVTEIEICVPSSRATIAERALNSVFERLPPPDTNLCNDYKDGRPRYRVDGEVPVVLLSDLGLGGETPKIVDQEEHGGQSLYSDEILSFLSVEQIKSLPILTLSSFLQYLAERRHNTMHRIQLEQLVDAMGIEEEWCHHNLLHDAHVRPVMELVQTKMDRVDTFQDPRGMGIDTTRIPGYQYTAD
ncbi:hypothetical protein AYO20_02287 [Fonsecaea nubica]|uniref:Uncharacterized protein n=1 Tax=Fonsecaea nubica TaxID=856822 RepID=A0A178D7Z6_9EURO|nr:hypothetical protein AYO20_02287 [Fonsecaea nubica]OAL38228.1 hypothetical protein AYO20_02287 [Fonsecaea nubica]